MANTWRHARTNDLRGHGDTSPRSGYLDEEEEYGHSTGKRPKRSRNSAKASLMELAHLPREERDELSEEEDSENGDELPEV